MADDKKNPTVEDEPQDSTKGIKDLETLIPEDFAETMDVPKVDASKDDVPTPEEPKDDVPKPEEPASDLPKAEDSKDVTPKPEEPTSETPKDEPPKVAYTDMEKGIFALNEGLQAEDVEDYLNACRDYGRLYYDAPSTEVEGMREYIGVNGQCIYDPKQFQLMNMETEMPDGSKAGGEVLVYIGSETDGSKIQIPKGLTNITGMFANTAIKSAPSIPDGVRVADMAFMGCKNLVEAKGALPRSLETANMTWAACPNLVKGPAQLPVNLRQAEYAFANDVSLKMTPRTNRKLEYLSGMCMGCSNLRTPLSIPKNAKRASYAMSDCAGIDEAQDQKAEAQLQKAREKFMAKEKAKVTRKEKGTMLGRAMSSIMQVHAMRSMGYGAVMAPILTHMMRKNGMVGTDFRSGIGMAMMRTNPMLGRMVLTSATKKAEERGKAAQARFDKKMAQWDRTNTIYTIGLKEGRGLFERVPMKADKDVRSNLFLRMSHMDGVALNQLRETHGREAAYDAHDAVLYNTGLIQNDVGLRHSTASWYKARLQEYAVYFKEAEDGIKAKYPVDKRVEAMNNLRQMKDLALEPITQSMRSMQDYCQLFNDGDIRDIDRMMKGMTGETVFAGHIEMSQTVAFPTMSEPHKATDEEFAAIVHERRAAEAARRFGDVGKSDGKPNDGPGFGK